MIYLDNNNIIAVWEQPLETGKQFTRSFHGYPLTAYDHTVFLYTKKWVLPQQWKDIGAGQYVFQKHPTAELIRESVMQLGFARLWFDILYKYDDADWTCRNIAKPDSVVVEYTTNKFGSSGQALVMPSYDACLLQNNIISYLFGISLAHGKWFIKDGVLLPLKITIPCTSSLMGKEQFLKEMTDRLQEMGVVHSTQVTTGGSAASSYPIVQIIIHDPYILWCYKNWLDPIVKINKISTNDMKQYAYEQCVAVVWGSTDPVVAASIEVLWLSLENIVLISCD